MELFLAGISLLCHNPMLLYLEKQNNGIGMDVVPVI